MLFLIIIGLMAAIALTSYHTSVVAGHRNLTAAMPQTITGMITGSGTSALTGITGTIGYIAYWNSANTISSEQYVSAAQGGTGLSTSGSTGVPYVTSGTWSVDNPTLKLLHGGTGTALTANATYPSVITVPTSSTTSALVTYTPTNLASTIVSRDGSGNCACNVLTVNGISILANGQNVTFSGTSGIVSITPTSTSKFDVVSALTTSATGNTNIIAVNTTTGYMYLVDLDIMWGTSGAQYGGSGIFTQRVKNYNGTLTVATYSASGPYSEADSQVNSAFYNVSASGTQFSVYVSPGTSSTMRWFIHARIMARDMTV